jgi:hypothetical protein
MLFGQRGGFCRLGKPLPRECTILFTEKMERASNEGLLGSVLKGSFEFDDGTRPPEAGEEVDGV